MRDVMFVLFALASGGVLLTHLNLPAAPVSRASSAPSEADDWRRTVEGWERSHAWAPESSRAQLSDFALVHPLGLAAFQLIGSLAALAIYSPSGRQFGAGRRKRRDAGHE